MGLLWHPRGYEGKGEIRSHIKALAVLTKLVSLGFTCCCFLLSPCLWCLLESEGEEGPSHWAGLLAPRLDFFPGICVLKNQCIPKRKCLLLPQLFCNRNYFTLNCSFCSPTVLQRNVPSRALISFTGEAEHQTGLAVTAGSVCEAGSPKETIFPWSLACVSMAGAWNLMIFEVPSNPICDSGMGRR